MLRMLMGALRRAGFPYYSRLATHVRGLLTSEKAMQYEEAVRTLNVLQTNGQKPLFRDGSCLVAMQELLNRVGITQQNLKDLRIVHVSGTKGKGSTCAFVESILRHHGYKTGFFSSPHLIEVRERIRINGEPISRKEFSEYFEDVYNKFTETREGSSHEYPTYFYFLTIMAFYVFVKKRVDVAIMEVGIGGSFDCTNVAQQTAVCGVTSLGYDHVALLGHTIESIAWHKAGIFKPGISAFTSPQQHSALQVMAQTAFDNDARLEICPDLTAYRLPAGRRLKLGLNGEHQRMNASLALQIANLWLKKKQLKVDHELMGYTSEVEAFPTHARPFPLTEKHLKALENCSWKGRAQVVKFRNLTFYLDGAHTTRSMRCCADWFRSAADEEERCLGKRCLRILAFNITGQRDPTPLFAELKSCGIFYAFFTPNIATLAVDNADQTNLKSSIEDKLLCAVRNHNEWLRHASTDSDMKCDLPVDAPIFPTIANAVAWLSEGRDKELFASSSKLSSHENLNVPLLHGVPHVQVLVTGSVHLVGGFLKIVEPTCHDK